MSNTPFVPSYFGKDAGSFLSSDLAGEYMDLLGPSSMPTFRHGVGGAMEQPDNSGFLPGATTTLPPSPEQAPMQFPDGVDRNLVYIMQSMKKDANTDWREQADYLFDKRREEAERANRMGQWNTIMGSVLKDLPRTLSEQYRRSNMYIGDMLRMQQDQVREYGAGIRQSLASMPATTDPPARNYIRI